MSKLKDSLLLTAAEQRSFLPAFDEHILFALERRYMDFLDIRRLEMAFNPAADSYSFESNLRMIRIDEISYQGEARDGLHLLNMQNVLAALKDPSHSVVNVIRSDGLNSTLYYGLSRKIGFPTEVSTSEYARMLGQTIHGNFLVMSSPERG